MLSVPAIGSPRATLYLGPELQATFRPEIRLQSVPFAAGVVQEVILREESRHQ